MEFICTHCQKRTDGTPFRVYSEEAGVTLLDQLTCALCAIEARKLKLSTIKLTLPGDLPALRVFETITEDERAPRRAEKLP
jgi:hypothetical protein